MNHYTNVYNSCETSGFSGGTAILSKEIRAKKRLALIGAVLMVACAPLARAAAIESLTLTPVGTNTVFTITGTYPANMPLTFFSAPNTSYSLTFVLPTTPSSLSFIDTDDGIFGVDTTVSLNGNVFPDSQIAFFDISLDGGLDVCLSDGCAEGPPAILAKFSILGDQLYTGDVSHPSFISGVAGVDSSQSFIENPTPEPASLTLTGAGIVALAMGRRRKRLFVPLPVPARVRAGKRSHKITP